MLSAPLTGAFWGWLSAAAVVVGCGLFGLGAFAAVMWFVARLLAPSIRERYADRVMPVALRWALPRERPMLLLVGRRGKGKTALAVKIALARMRAGERVYANFELCDEARGLRAGRIWSLLDCMELEDCTVVVDGANQWCSAREWQLMPADVLADWQESRKTFVSFIFTSQHEDRVDVVLRELVDWLFLCEQPALLPWWFPVVRVQRTYLEEINEVRRGRVSRARWEWLPSDVLAAYNTRERSETANQTAVLKAYKDAIKSGEPIDRLALGLPERREPSRCDRSGLWGPWDWTDDASEATGEAVAVEAL